MTLLEYNSMEQSYLRAMQTAIQEIYATRIIPVEGANTWQNFTEETKDIVLGTLGLLQDKARTNAKYYGAKERLKELST